MIVACMGSIPSFSFVDFMDFCLCDCILLKGIDSHHFSM